MEPDSSTDTQEQEQEQEQELEGEGEGEEGDRMQRLLQEHARLFSVKTEPEGAASGPPAAKRLKTYQSAQEELSELMKLTNEKLFKNTSSALPLSVEIDTEQDSSSDSVSPPRNPFTVTAHHAAAGGGGGGALSPRKRGRKPKHYSEILYELGQRGISITKTGAGRQQGGGGCGGPAPRPSSPRSS